MNKTGTQGPALPLSIMLVASLGAIMYIAQGGQSLWATLRGKLAGTACSWAYEQSSGISWSEPYQAAQQYLLQFRKIKSGGG
ncbi:hypothetical protein ACFP56_07905 [Paenibacillus septentrionalis]|uniref:Uncharacterized protein n=2 Tax=Paenibacillus septentrionalis TaxID=429342 RepID=A0ABW1V1C1_9BACL